VRACRMLCSANGHRVRASIKNGMGGSSTCSSGEKKASWSEKKGELNCRRKEVVSPELELKTLILVSPALVMQCGC